MLNQVCKYTLYSGVMYVAICSCLATIASYVLETCVKNIPSLEIMTLTKDFNKVFSCYFPAVLYHVTST